MTNSIRESIQFGILPKIEWSVSRGSTTPSVENQPVLQFTNSVATLVTNFLDGSEGQVIHILGDGFTSIQNGTNIKTSSGLTELLGLNKCYSYIYKYNSWYSLLAYDIIRQISALSAQVSTTSTTLANIGLPFNINVGEGWVVEYLLPLSCNNVGGVKLAFAGLPSGVTGRVTYFGNTTGAGVYTTVVNTTLTTVNNWSTFNSSAAPVFVRATAYLKSTTGSGAINLQYGSVTAGQSSVIYEGAYVSALRVS